MNRLSYSQLRLYSECGKKYYYYYKEKLRERSKSGALFFGTALDKALEAVNQANTVDEKRVFDEHWTHQEINGKKVYLPDSLLVGYSATDFDWDLLSQQDKSFLEAKRQELVPSLMGDTGDIAALFAVRQCASFKKQKAFRHFKEAENRYLNIANWLSLKQKGYLMLDAHRQEIMPRIKKVLGTQVEISLANDSGDTLLGYVDLHATWDDGTDIVFDYKTSSLEYEEDAVLVSPQLSIYTHALHTRRAGFIVFQKAIQKNKIKTCEKCQFDGSNSRALTCNNESAGKRCNGKWVESVNPKARIQVLIDEIPERTEEIVLENIETVNAAIRANIFPRNLGACKASYGHCPYLSLCYKNVLGDLEKVN